MTKHSSLIGPRVILYAAAFIACSAFLLLSKPAAPVSASGGSVSGVDAWVGYYDTLRANAHNLPTPWDGAANVTFEGCTPASSCVFDAGAVRVVNNTPSAVTVNSVEVDIDTCVYNIWPPASLPPGAELIVTQTANQGPGCNPSSGSFDSSDIGPGSSDYNGNCAPNGIVPIVKVRVNGTTSTFSDSGQVLNTGGFDKANCPPGSNESTQWTPIGSIPCPSAMLALSPASQKKETGTKASVQGTLTNSCGDPLQNATVAFSVLSGPNAGGTGSVTTDTKGVAMFSYSSFYAGTDVLEASVTNPAGTFTSNDVNVTWNALPTPTPTTAPTTVPPSPTPTEGPVGGISMDPGFLVAATNTGSAEGGAWAIAGAAAAVAGAAIFVGTVWHLRRRRSP